MIIATHNGKFHADDVFGVALLKQLYPDAQVVRSRDPKVLDQADIVLDVGGVYDVEARRFDHHQVSSGARD
ncbi:MYG1 family protein, partial [Timonella senegalensis]